MPSSLNRDWKAYQLIACSIAFGDMAFLSIKLIGITKYAEGGAFLQKVPGPEYHIEIIENS